MRGSEDQEKDNQEYVALLFWIPKTVLHNIFPRPRFSPLGCCRAPSIIHFHHLTRRLSRKHPPSYKVSTIQKVLRENNLSYVSFNLLSILLAMTSFPKPSGGSQYAFEFKNGQVRQNFSESHQAYFRNFEFQPDRRQRPVQSTNSNVLEGGRDLCGYKWRVVHAYLFLLLLS
jgi:hypothetical protein